jgi:hypothetical protein
MKVVEALQELTDTLQKATGKSAKLSTVVWRFTDGDSRASFEVAWFTKDDVCVYAAFDSLETASAYCKGVAAVHRAS